MKRILAIFVAVLVFSFSVIPAFAYTPPADSIEWKVYIIWGEDPAYIPYGTTVTLYNYQFDNSAAWADYAGQQLIYTRDSNEPSSNFVGYSPQPLYMVSGMEWAAYDKYEQDLWHATDEKYIVSVDSYNLTDCTLWLSVSLAEGADVEPSEPTEPTEPERDWELSGGYYIVCDSALGSDMTYYVPADFATGSLAFDESGNLFNLTSSSIYLYSPDYPDYTIYAPRFGVFQYRKDSGYGSTYVDLNLHNVTDANVEIFDSNPPLVTDSPVDFSFMFDLITLVLLVLIFLRMGRL